MVNRAILLCDGAILYDFTESNTTGLFRRKARGVDWYSNQNRISWGYYSAGSLWLTKS